jgi:hypothetical protein
VAIHFLGLSKFAAELSRPDLGLEGYLFLDERNNLPVAVYWSSKDNAADTDLPIHFDWSKYEAYDAMGNLLPAGKAVLRSKDHVVILAGKPGSSIDDIKAAFGAPSL